MEIKGKIGDEVYVKGIIDQISINEDGVFYYVTFAYSAEHEENFKFEDVVFKEPKKPEKKVPEVKKDVEPIAPPKKRGRPRKTTVDDLVKKAKM